MRVGRVVVPSGRLCSYRGDGDAGGTVAVDAEGFPLAIPGGSRGWHHVCLSWRQDATGSFAMADGSVLGNLHARGKAVLGGPSRLLVGHSQRGTPQRPSERAPQEHAIVHALRTPYMRGRIVTT